jgi:hypothetical protein
MASGQEAPALESSPAFLDERGMENEGRRCALNVVH